MNRNYMSSIAEILGVEIDKGFEVYRGNSLLGTYKITENGLMYENTSKSDEIVLEDILTGICHINKQWIPKEEEYYFVPTISYKADYNKAIWRDTCFDDAHYENGLVCKTPEEAIKLAEVALQAIKKYREG